MMKKLLIVLLFGLLSACASQSTYVPATTTKGAQHAKVTVYGAGGCVNTLMTKMYLQQHHIPYQYYSVSSSEKGRDFYAKLNGPGVPIITVGKDRIIGYDKDELHHALQQAKYTV